MEQKIENLDLTEIENVYGGPLPLVAYLTATGLGIIASSIAAFNNGYTVGRDLARAKPH